MPNAPKDVKPTDFPRTLDDALKGSWKYPEKGDQLLAAVVIHRFPKALTSPGGVCGYRVVDGHPYPCYPDPATGVCNQCLIPR